MIRSMRFAAIALVALATAFGAGRSAEAGPTLVFDVRSGEVLHSYRPYDRWYPASLTKLMTAYVTFQAVSGGQVTMRSPVTISAAAAAQPPSKMGYKVGTQIALEDALKILMVKSANDVAAALAESVAGSEAAFVAAMNRAAARLGMSDSNFVNPHGLPDSRQVTSARDLALLTMALHHQFGRYGHFFSMPSIQVGNRVMKNHNKLIGRFRGADGMKTGFICASGFNVVSTATRGGRRLAVVVLGATNSRHREEVAAALLEAGFAQGGGFKLFSGPRTRLGDLRRPSRIVPPVDMRPYACQKRTPPAEIASFGFVEQPAAGSDDAALALAPTVDLREPVRRAAPVSSLTAPLPRIRPFITQPSAATPVVPGPAGMSGAPFPQPNPRRERTYK